ncbi:MAG: hypothetical protein RLZZ182_1782, partial [Pseudomonadota bacterium]
MALGSLKGVAACAVAAAVTVCAAVPGAHAADALERLNASTEVERAQALAGGGATGTAWVHCLLPGQVRRLGMSVVATPRRAVRMAPPECLAAGGEYVEPQDTVGALKIWLPLAADGMPEAQATAGELYEQQGQLKLARVWYEKAAAAGVARAQFNLANLESQAGSDRTASLLAAASGGWVAGLVMAPRDRLRIDVVAPEAAMRLPRPVDGVLTVEASPQAHELVARVVAPAGLASLKVNGQVVQPDPQGLVQVPLVASAASATAGQVFALEAQDSTGGLARTEVRVLQRSLGQAGDGGAAGAAGTAASPESVLAQAPTAAGQPAAATPPQPALAAAGSGRRWALLIANQAYSAWGPLDTPVQDAQAVGDVLRDRYGFDVQWVRNGTRAQMLQALQTLRSRVGPNDQVLVYYAGHGQMDSVTARGYWIPVDGDRQDVSRWVSVIDVTDQLSAMSAKHVMVIADSCYSGTLTHSLMPQIDTALADTQRRQALDFLSRQKVRVAMTSGGLEPVMD